VHSDSGSAPEVTSQAAEAVAGSEQQTPNRPPQAGAEDAAPAAPQRQQGSAEAQQSPEEQVFGALAAAVQQYSTGGSLNEQEQQRTVEVCLRLLRHLHRCEPAWLAEAATLAVLQNLLARGLCAGPPLLCCVPRLFVAPVPLLFSWRTTHVLCHITSTKLDARAALVICSQEGTLLYLVRCFSSCSWGASWTPQEPAAVPPAATADPSTAAGSEAAAAAAAAATAQEASLLSPDPRSTLHAVVQLLARLTKDHALAEKVGDGVCGCVVVCASAAVWAFRCAIDRSRCLRPAAFLSADVSLSTSTLPPCPPSPACPHLTPAGAGRARPRAAADPAASRLSTGA
jgi:hypothetical protein